MSALALHDTRYLDEDEKISTTYNYYNTVIIPAEKSTNTTDEKNTIFFFNWKPKKIQKSSRSTDFFNIPISDEDLNYPNIFCDIKKLHLEINNEFVNQILEGLKELGEKHIIHSVDYLYENLEPALCKEKYDECNSLYSAISNRVKEYDEQIFVTMLSIASRWRKHFDRYNEFFKETEHKLLEKHTKKEVDKILKGWRKYVG